MARETIASLRTERDRDYVKKSEVAEVAMRYAREHDLCSVVQDALDELGIKEAKRTAKITVTLEFEDVPLSMDEEDIRSALYVEDSCIDADAYINMSGYEIVSVVLGSQ